MSDEEEEQKKKERRQKRKQEKAAKLRDKQEEALKKAHEEENRDITENVVPEAMAKKGYTLGTEELSSDSFSKVFKGKRNDEDIVIRVIEKEKKDKKFVEKLIPRFVRILRALDERNPNIISTLDVFETPKRVLILMSLTPNGNLYDFLNTTTDQLDENQTRKWAQELIHGLCYLHINGIVHRDLRSERILLDKNNSLKISGFTYSRLWLNPTNDQIVLDNKSVGTGPYCAPETLSNESYDPRTIDVWAYGVIVFYIWNKSYPFDYNQIQVLLAQQRNSEWIKDLRSETNDLLKELFKKTFDINHSQRQTIINLLKDKWIESKFTIEANESDSQTKETSDSKTNESSDSKTNKSSDSKTNESSDSKTNKSSDSKTNESSDSKLKSNRNTEKVEKKENVEKEDNEDMDDEEIDDNNEDEVKSESTSEKTSPQNKSNDNKDIKPKNDTKVKSSLSSDEFVIKADILEKLKKEFISLKIN